MRHFVYLVTDSHLVEFTFISLSKEYSNQIFIKFKYRNPLYVKTKHSRLIAKN